MTHRIPAPSDGPPVHRPTLIATAPLPLWRVWHPSLHVTAPDQPSTHGPKARFDPHPPGPATVHPDGPAVWYGSIDLPTAICETHARGPTVVDLCRHTVASLVTVDVPVRLYDLTDGQTCDQLGIDRQAGDRVDVDYADTQAWARHLHGHADGIRYHSARHRAPTTGARPAHRGRLGINIALFARPQLAAAPVTHRLADDLLFPHVMAALDQADVAVTVVNTCNRCS